MQASTNFGKCGLCGVEGKLTFEHVPPKAAFNDRGVLLVDLKHLFLDGEVSDPRTARMRKSPQGVGGKTLCAPCNNDTGAWYGNAYIDWAIQGMMFRLAAPAGSSLHLPFHIFPARIAKQILCMFASACGPGLFESNHDLRRFVLNRDFRGLPPKYRLYCYLMDPASNYSRQSGTTGMISGRDLHVFAEIAFPPFGYILTMDSPTPDKGLADITPFTTFGFHDFRSEYFRLPVRPVNSYYPADFRSAEDWAATLNRVHGPAPARHAAIAG